VDPEWVGKTDSYFATVTLQHLGFFFWLNSKVLKRVTVRSGTGRTVSNLVVIEPEVSEKIKVSNCQ
jgi:hypothetical protein